MVAAVVTVQVFPANTGSREIFCVSMGVDLTSVIVLQGQKDLLLYLS
jgi:hypothetical protein